MPYKSEAQRRFFHSEGAKKAGITRKDIKHFDEETKKAGGVVRKSPKPKKA